MPIKLKQMNQSKSSKLKSWNKGLFANYVLINETKDISSVGSQKVFSCCFHCYTTTIANENLSILINEAFYSSFIHVTFSDTRQPSSSPVYSSKLLHIIADQCHFE